MHQVARSKVHPQHFTCLMMNLVLCLFNMIRKAQDEALAMENLAKERIKG